MPLNDVRNRSPSPPIGNRAPDSNKSGSDPSHGRTPDFNESVPDASREVHRVSRPLPTEKDLRQERGPDVSAPAVDTTCPLLPSSQHDGAVSVLARVDIGDETVPNSPPFNTGREPLFPVDDERELAESALSPVITGREAIIRNIATPELAQPIGLDVEPAMSPREKAKQAYQSKKPSSVAEKAPGNETTAVEHSVGAPPSTEVSTGTATTIQRKIAVDDIDALTVPACVDQHFVYLRGILQGHQEDELLLNWLALECQDEVKSVSKLDLKFLLSVLNVPATEIRKIGGHFATEGHICVAAR